MKHKKEDGLMFCVLSCFRKREKLKLKSIIDLWNFFDHSTPTVDDINCCLNRLENDDFISVDEDNRIYFLPKFKTFEKKNKKFREGHIEKQVRYQHIFEQLEYNYKEKDGKIYFKDYKNE